MSGQRPDVEKYLVLARHSIRCQQIFLFTYTFLWNSFFRWRLEGFPSLYFCSRTL